MNRLLIVTLALVFVPTGLAAAPQSGEPQAGPAAQTEVADAEAEPAEEKKICRTERMTGSRTRRTKICLTQAEWREVHDRTREDIGDMQRSVRPGQAAPSMPGG